MVRADRVLCFLGAPGAGKSVQTLKIKSIMQKQGFNVYRFCPGEELRKANIQCANGGLADIDTVNKLFDNACSEHTDLFIVDGYPRSVDQAMHFIKNTVGNGTKTDLFLMSIDAKHVYDRLNKRIICFTCNNIDNIKTNKTLECKKCGAKMSFRQDDISIEAIQLRQNIFLKSVDTIVSVLSQNNIDIHDIDATLPSEEILESVLMVLKKGKIKSQNCI